MFEEVGNFRALYHFNFKKFITNLQSSQNYETAWVSPNPTPKEQKTQKNPTLYGAPKFAGKKL